MKLPSQHLLTGERIRVSIRERFNPTKSITAQGLVAAHDEFDRGNLRAAAMMWDVIEDRDDLIKGVASKRKKNIARNGFEVVTFVKEGAPEYEEAFKQKRALEFFYDQVVVTHAIDSNERGGFKLLVRQMMDAIGKQFAVHEIVWKVVEERTTGPSRKDPPPHPSVSPKQERVSDATPYRLTAELRFVPLWFFENTTGRLRFLKQPYALEGAELEEGAWMITTGGWSDEGVRACLDAEESGVE